MSGITIPILYEPYAFAGVGVALILAGVWGVLKAQRFVANAICTTGIVAGHEQKQDSSDASDGFIYYPIFEFKDSAGVHRRVISKVGGYPKPFPNGGTVQLFYSPDDPQNAKAATYGQLWRGPVILLLCGAFCVVAAWTKWST